MTQDWKDCSLNMNAHHWDEAGLRPEGSRYTIRVIISFEVQDGTPTGRNDASGYNRHEQ